MNRENGGAHFSQRQLRVGELIKQSLGQIFLRDIILFFIRYDIR